MASVKLKPKLMLIPSVRSMLELSPDTDLMLLPPTPGMLVLDMLVMLDILAM